MDHLDGERWANDNGALVFDRRRPFNFFDKLGRVMKQALWSGHSLLRVNHMSSLRCIAPGIPMRRADDVISARRNRLLLVAIVVLSSAFLIGVSTVFRQLAGYAAGLIA